jgi:hypothetical protein
MKLKRFTQAGLVAATVAVAGVGLALPASASGTVTCDGYFCKATALDGGGHYFEAEVTNNPGDGAASWIWVWTNQSAYKAHTDYYLRDDGTMHKYYSPLNGANSMDLPKDVTAFRVCGSNGGAGDTCSSWAHPLY